MRSCYHGTEGNLSARIEGPQVKASSNIVKLKPLIMSDGILQVGGRILRAPISPDAMNPMILPKNHHVTTILIRYVHEKWTLWS